MKYDMSQRKNELSSTAEPPVGVSEHVRRMLDSYESKLADDNRFRKPPPPPQRKAPPPPPPPSNRKPPLSPPSSSSSPSFFDPSPVDSEIQEVQEVQEMPLALLNNISNLRRSLGPKPKVAPKPLFLNGEKLLASSSASEIQSSFRSDVATPTILVSPAADRSDRSFDFQNGFARAFSAAENGNGGIKDIVRQLETSGFVPRANSSQMERPISCVSTLSQVSDEFDDGTTSASEDESTNDEKQLRRHRHEDDFDELPLPRHDRKTTMVATTHSEIMSEMEHLFVRGGAKKANGSTQKRRQSNIDEIPADVGKLRDNRKGRHNSLFVSPTSGVSSVSDDFSRITSMTSDRSSIVTSNSAGGDSADSVIPDYATGDEEEDKRLKKLHYAAVEFQKVQTNYVQYLKEMAVLYPDYMERFGRRVGRDLLGPHNGHENVVLQIKKIMLQILPLHEMLLKEIDNVCTNWDSRSPHMSKTIATYADFLKCCQPFLDNKADFLAKLLQLRNEDKEFDEATFMFETEVFKRGKKGAVIQQLDQVHQNFMRYKLLMLRYSEYLVDGSDEKKEAEGAIEKLERMTQVVNQKMGLPTTEELTKLYYRFQCQFNVLEPGRVLIRQGDVMKQTRKEEQPRFLVLFTDCLWICRVGSTRGSTPNFEMHRSYRIPLEYMRFERMEDDDRVRCMMVKSKVKSAVIIFSSEKERNLWADDLTKAQYERKSYKRRQSTATQRHDENKLKMKKLMLLAEKNIEEGQEDRPQALGAIRSRSQSISGSQDELSSVPVTPCDLDICPDFSDELPAKVGTKKQSSDVVKPVWLPDNISNECLMEGCSTEFSIINRRHHCRDCGWLICKYCKGQAPLSKYEFEKLNVCSECYDKIYTLYKAGTLFPTKNLVTTSDGSCYVKIGKKHEQNIVDPRKLFKAPFNAGLRHRNVDEKRASSIVFGKVYLRSRKTELVRHALLRRDDLKLAFYKAELDSKPSFEVLIIGYVFRETRLDGGGWFFELVHRNQIRTDDTKDDVIAFRVDNSASAKKWSAAFADKLELDSSQPSE